MKLKQQISLQNSNGKVALASVGHGGGSITESSDTTSRSLNRMNSIIGNNDSQDMLHDIKCMYINTNIVVKFKIKCPSITLCEDI